MPRTVKEWIGADDDTKIPERVRQRILARADHRCEVCGNRIRAGGEIDHIVALANWRQTKEAPHGNRESNLRVLCALCHAAKSRADVAEKSKVAQIKKRLGPL